MLARLPLMEATEPGEAALWVQALDSLGARVESLRHSLRRLAPESVEDEHAEEGRSDG